MNIFISIPKNEVGDTFITDKSLEKLKSVGNVTRNESDRDLNIDEVVELAKDAEVIICGWDTIKFTKEVTDKLPKLKLIAYVAGSMEPVVDETVYEKGIRTLTGNYIFAKSVAEGCLAYMLCALRELERFMGQVRAGGWNENHRNRGLFGKKVGIVGFGQIAKNLVKMLQLFDMEILIHSNHISEEEATSYGAKKATKEEIFSTCDIVSVHSSLTDKTRGSINRELLSMLKPDALFVNTARGAIVDEKAMTELLEEGRFWAAIDVFSQEPLPADDKLRSLKNVCLFPHMGGPTIDMREYIVCSFAKDIAAFEKGEYMENEIGAECVSRMSKH